MLFIEKFNLILNLMEFEFNYVDEKIGIICTIILNGIWMKNLKSRMIWLK